MEELGEEIARRRGIPLKVRGESDRRTALTGADFVITAFSVGGFESMQHDIEIPRRFGIRQPIGDSVGPGGIMRALRSIPVLVAIARDIEAVAPNAWLVNVTNPLTALCRAVTRETAVKTVGLCNEWVGCSWALSLLFDSGMSTGWVCAPARHSFRPGTGGIRADLDGSAGGCAVDEGRAR
jgi:alpha-galactosidase